MSLGIAYCCRSTHRGDHDHGIEKEYIRGNIDRAAKTVNHVFQDMSRQGLWIALLAVPVGAYTRLPLYPRLLTAPKTKRYEGLHHAARQLLSDEKYAPTLEKIPSSFEPLFNSAINATSIRGADTSNHGHDSFRYEWGTWVVEESLEYLMQQINLVRLKNGAYDTLLQNKSSSIRLRVAGGSDWDCFLHILPQNTEWKGRWPTGSWAIVKSLSGMVEVASLSGPNRDGSYKTKTSKKLRGGGDGSLGGGQSSAGENAIKYVGGPLRCYRGSYGKSALMEIVIRPPIGLEYLDEDIDILKDLDSTFTIAELLPETVEDTESPPASRATPHLGVKLGMEFEKVGGLDKQLEAIARRVLASRANPAAARRLGVSHVRGILLSGPPGCGKTLLARELASMLGAREPQIVNGPEILDKYIGEAEKKVRELFLPAEQEYKAAGDDSALHIIILDEMDAIARKRGTMTADTTGVRDSVVNQLLAKMDGVREASNILVVGLTNRPELLDPALLRPGRLEVQLRVELPDLEGRRAILRIHTRQMKLAGGLNSEAVEWIEDLSEGGLAAATDYYSGAELAGLVRSAASFALSRTFDSDDKNELGVVTRKDLEASLQEVRAALGKQDELLQLRCPFGVSLCSDSTERVSRDLKRFTIPMVELRPQIQSLLLVGGGGKGGAGVTALAAWAAIEASNNGITDYVRFITALDVLSDSEGGDDASRAAALVSKFEEAKTMPHSLLVLDDVDQLCAGQGACGYSSIMVATLRALLRTPPAGRYKRREGDKSNNDTGAAKSIHIIGTTSRTDAACVVLHELFDETIVVPLLNGVEEVASFLSTADLSSSITDPEKMAQMIVDRLGNVGVKTVIRITERAVAESISRSDGSAQAQVFALRNILDDINADGDTTQQLCEVLV